MNLDKIKTKALFSYILVGAAVANILAIIEYIVRIKTNDNPQDLIPLLIRATIMGALVMGTVYAFNLYSRKKLMQKPFIYLVFVRSFFYTLIITFSLLIINGFWFLINNQRSVYVEYVYYITDDMFVINLTTGFSLVVLAVGLSQINSLHKKGELFKFIIGRYHTPREVERIFCFVDLKNSTTIAEKLGHVRFAMFLKDYYADITEALRQTNAQIYQYVGDEIILNWSFERGLKNNNMINCFFEMRKIIEEVKPKYLDKYGVFPKFKAGLHGGKVIVTWIGELKKEIVYIGDVLNTTARIQEDCKRLRKDFLISENLLDRIDMLGNIQSSFVEETIPRGKENPVKLYSLELSGQ